MNAEAVIAQVRTGTWPKNWRVHLYKDKGFIFHGEILLWGLAFIGLLTVPIIIGASFLGDAGAIGGSVLGLIAIIVLEILIIKKQRSINQQPKTTTQARVLVILPEGVVEGYTEWTDGFHWLNFAGIYKMALSYETSVTGYDGYIRSKTRYWLDVYEHNGNYFTWRIDERFWDGAYIGKSIMAAFEYYCRQVSLANQNWQGYLE